MPPQRFTQIRNAQDAIDKWWPIWFGTDEEEERVPPKMVWDASDQDIIEKCRSARNAPKFEALYDRGETGDYAHNESEADLALLSLLAFYTQDPGQLDRLFRGSKLYRKKWERADYRDMTISRALDRGAYYEPPANTAEGITVYRSSEEVDPETGEISEKRVVFNQTDLGNAKRLVYHHGKHIRYVHAWKTWLIWTGSRWKIDGSGEIFRLAKDTAKRIYAEATAIDDEKARLKLLKWAETSESGPKLREMVGLAASEEGIPVEVGDLDRDPMLLNVQNGTINLKTGELQPHDPSDLITKLAPVRYDPDAAAPMWDQFLSVVMKGDDSLVEYLQRAVGYSLTGDVTERKMFILHGGGRNGKSTFLDTIHTLLGDYAARSPNEILVAQRNGMKGIPSDVARLVGIRFTFVSETGEFDRLDEAKVRDLVSGDVITARRMHQDFFDFKPEFKLWAGTNNRPNVRSSDQAVWDRVNLIPFDVRIPEEQVDYGLGRKLRRELSGILAWAVRGCLAWQQDHGLESPTVVKTATEQYRESMDVVGAFITEECLVRQGTSEPVSSMYAAYKEWATASGEHPMTKKMLTMRLNDRGFPSGRVGRDRTRSYLNIRLRTAMDDEE